MASELKVNTIKKSSGSTITVGESGDTVTLASGAVVSGGFKDIQWQTVITADGSTNTTAEAGKGYFIDTSSAAHTINLPSSPGTGDTVAIKDYAETFGTNNLSIAGNGSNIQGISGQNSIIETNRASVVLVYVDSTKGWLFTNESNVSALTPEYMQATGGTVSTDGNYKIHTFTTDGCFVVSDTGNQTAAVDYMVIAGGGGSGSNRSGGGGAGGWRASSGTSTGSYTAGPSPLTSPVPAITVTVQTYPITVGAGGAAGPPSESAAGNNGSNSVFSTITASGGGYGAPNQGPVDAGDGGSGGGNGADSATQGGSGGSGNTPPVSPPQGSSGSPAPAGGNAGAGGGGIGGAGNALPSTDNGGPGGPGVSSSITGSSVTYAGGGGGHGPVSKGTGGPGGGGNGSQNCSPSTQAQAGTANTGGGAGGGNAPGGTGASGGSGLVVLRYRYQ